MLKLLLSIIIEVFIGVSLAGIILALLIPALGLSDSVGRRDLTVISIIVGVLVATVAVALFRPGSALHRYVKR